MTPSRARLAPPDSVDDIVAWLNAMPAVQRERVARLLVDRPTATAIGLCRAQAVLEMTRVPGETWATVAARLGVGESAINRLVTIAKTAEREAARKGE